jgi:hypothetical protein
VETADASAPEPTDDRKTMQAATALGLSHDRNCSWYDEVQRIIPGLASLPLDAQRAVRTVIASIVQEDAEQPGRSLTAVS